MGWRTNCVVRPFPFRPISPRDSASAVRPSQAEKARFLNIAEGSAEECRYYRTLSQDLGYGQSESLMKTLEETSKLLNAYARAILASGS
jgi:four helix bundle protein